MLAIGVVLRIIKSRIQIELGRDKFVDGEIKSILPFHLYFLIIGEIVDSTRPRKFLENFPSIVDCDIRAILFS